MTNKEKVSKKSKPDQSAVKNAQTSDVTLMKKVKRGAMHPNYREIEVVQTDGVSFKVRSTYKNTIMKLDIDPKTHPAWTKEAGYINTKSSEVAKFNNKFGGLSFKLK